MRRSVAQRAKRVAVLRLIQSSIPHQSCKVTLKDGCWWAGSVQLTGSRDSRFACAQHGTASEARISIASSRIACAAAWHSERSALPCSGSSRAESHARVARLHCDLVAGGQGQCRSLSISGEIAGLHAPQRGTASEARCRAQAHPKLNPTPELQGYIKRWLMVGRISAAH